MTKAVSSALYVELRNSTRTAQVLIIPPVKNPLADNHEPMRVLTRQISFANPRRAWRFYTSPARIDALPTEDLTVASWSAVPLIEDITSFLVGFSHGGWELYKSFLTVEMSTDDIAEVSASNTPNALIRRVLRSRIEAGFEEALFAEPAPAPTY
jgi:hypothetical protein